MIRPGNALAALVAATLGGLVIGEISEVETVLLALLGWLVGLVAVLGARAQTRPLLAWTAVACLVVGGAAGLVVARVPVEQSLASAARSVVLNPVIVAGFAVGARLSSCSPGWAGRSAPEPDAPSASSRPARQSARTTVASSR